MVSIKPLLQTIRDRNGVDISISLSVLVRLDHAKIVLGNVMI